MARRLAVTTADRLTLLGAVEQYAPQVLDELRVVQIGDELALAQWARRWSLSAEWVLDTARRTLDWWARGRGGRSWRLSRPAALRRETDKYPPPMGTQANKLGARASGYPRLGASPAVRHRARRALKGEGELLETVVLHKAFVRWHVLGEGVMQLRKLWPGYRPADAGSDSYDRAMAGGLEALRLDFGLPRRPKAKPGPRGRRAV